MSWSPTTADVPALPGRLDCYTCGHEYDYVGESPHPGCCPACGSRTVSPAGSFDRLAHPTPVLAGPGESDYRVDATDRTDRTFGYWIATIDEDRAQLVRIGVEDAVLGPEHAAWPGGLEELVPGWLGRSIDSLDRELVAPRELVG